MKTNTIEAKELLKIFKKHCYCKTQEGTFYGFGDGICAWCEASNEVRNVFGVGGKKK